MAQPMQTMGGHFSAFLENRKNQFPGTQSFESARAALYALLITVKPAKIYVPNYICDAVTVAITRAGVPIERYSIDEDFKISTSIKLAKTDVILLVNYYGLMAEKLHDQIQQFPKSQIILDCSQAYFYENGEFLATIYSPRKFLPVPDGGFIRTKIDLLADSPDDEASIARYQYLLQRVVTETEHSRSTYLRSEEELESISVRSMSHFSRKISEIADLEFIKDRRRENYQSLQRLDRINRITLPLNDQVPLCYPLMIPDGEMIWARLIENRIFTPKYWPNVNPASTFEKSLLRDTIYLPIDHRYGKNQMGALVDFMFSMIGQENS